jgi:hypothetical protein
MPPRKKKNLTPAAVVQTDLGAPQPPNLHNLAAITNFQQIESSHSNKRGNANRCQNTMLQPSKYK